MSSTSPALSSAVDNAVPDNEPFTAEASAPDALLHGTPSAPPLRRLPVRNVQPPFDDELDDRATGTGVVLPGVGGSGASSQQGALKLAFTLASGVPAVPELATDRPSRNERATPALRLVPPIAERGRRRSADDVLDEEFGPRATPRALLPDPTPWAGRLVQAVVEAIAAYGQ